jgi:hypothetical protein
MALTRSFVLLVGEQDCSRISGLCPRVLPSLSLSARASVSEKVRAAPPRGRPCDAAGVRLVKPLPDAAARASAFGDRVGNWARLNRLREAVQPSSKASARASPGRH